MGDTEAIPRAPGLPGAHALFDPRRFLPALDAALAPLSNPRELRAAAVRYLATARAEAMEEIIAAFATHPRSARETVRAIASVTDATIAAAYHVAATRLHPLSSPTEGQHLTILAVGGYGRAEMAPRSDTDLLFLTPWKVTGWAESMVESILYMLWDLKMVVGHATRAIDDCLSLAVEDMTIRTTLLEHRLICGDAPLAEELRARLWPEVLEGTVPEFIEAKLAERDARHARQGGQRYMLEPNVKDGKGGLRDLQALYWIGKYIYRVERAQNLVDFGMLTREEHLAFWQAEDFLWAVRCHLHLITGRATDQLTFDLQPEVAARMDYHDGGGQRAVEHFMQDYFRQATHVGGLTRVFLTELEARHLRQPPLLQKLFGRRHRLRAPFVEEGGRIAISDRVRLREDPVAILRLFEEELRTGMMLHPQAMRRVAANLALIDDRVRTDPEARRIFLDLLLRHGNPEPALRRMVELGVLAAFIPEFTPVVAMMQFNVYHHYTVDEHLIQCVAALAGIERGGGPDNLRLAEAIMRGGGIDRTVIYLATLLHDIGKGRPEDHAILGARIARRVVARLGIDAGRTEAIEWLVRHHMLMSNVAQKRDISDPRTIRDFAKAVGTRKRLDLLTVLTVADICGVGPGTWNNWKSMLLQRLHASTAAVLEGGMEGLTQGRRAGDARRALREHLLAQGWDAKAARAELARHDDSYWAGLPTTAHATFAALLAAMPATPGEPASTPTPTPTKGGAKAPSPEGAGPESASSGPPQHEPGASGQGASGSDTSAADAPAAGAPGSGPTCIALSADPDREATRVAIVTSDHHGAFSQLAGALALAGTNVVDARTYTSHDGYATAMFWVQDLQGRPYGEDRLARLERAIATTLKEGLPARDTRAWRQHPRRRERAFRFPTHIIFDNEGSDLHTIIEVDTRDRPGLLYDLARTLSANRIQIVSAVIATFGAQVIDTFYVKDMSGLKLTDTARREALETMLRAAITEEDIAKG